MKKIRRYILLLPLMMFAAAGCLRIEEEDKAQAEELVTLSFKAVMEDNQTKTALAGGLGDAYRTLTWLPSDEIAVTSGWYNYARLANVNTEEAEVANFVGEAEYHETYYAVYPYTAVSSWQEYGSKVWVNVPVRQVYAENTFATDMNPMVARGARNETLQFKNLCGLLAINLKSENNDIVKSVSLAAYDAAGNIANIAGSFEIDMDFDYEAGPDLSSAAGAMMPGATGIIQMDCGEGVQLNGETSVPFHFVLAPGVYNKISVIVTTTDGKIMMREGKNPLTIKRAEWVAAGTLQYVENVSFDLSENGYANCYVVSEAGVYSFDASVIGNGDFGMVSNSGFHTDDPSISPVNAEILWEDRAGVVAGAACADGRISFVATGLEGNALIAAKDADGTILWSWHIWSVNDNIDDQVYVNSTGTYTVQDRNLGAVRDDRGIDEQWRETQGLFYQWGRKDPFTRHKQTSGNLYTTNNNRVSIVESVQNPTVFEGRGKTGWEETANSSLWMNSQKTIYDPCPSGYKVSSREIWLGFTNDSENHYGDVEDYLRASGTFDKGWKFLIDESGDNTAYYPATDLIYYNGDYRTRDSESYLWSNSYQSDRRANILRFYYNVDNSADSWIYIHADENTSYGFPVRCMKDDHAVTIVVSVSGITGITTSSASVNGYVSVDGSRTVSRRGFVCSISSDPVIESGMVVESGEGTGAFSAELTDLASDTKYYVRAFAVVDGETKYSKTSVFTTPNETGVKDLSAAGTANCYIISHAGTYKFKATVKGNGAAFVSNKSDASAKANEENTTINPDNVKIIWETLNTSDAVTQGAIISSVSLESGYVTFTTPDNFTPGNALIAVTRAGKVVWSWHIWAMESDPETDAQIYQSGAMMMDRNLGALNVNPGDVRSYGLFYQWGRKDPFLGCGNIAENTFAATYPTADQMINAIVTVSNDARYDNFAYALANPDHFIRVSNWNDDERYWDSHKTMYDPCPVGWRVPDRDAGVWDGFSVSRVYYGGYFDTPMSVPFAYYPHTGYIGNDGLLNSVNNTTYIWNALDRSTFRVNTGVGSDGRGQYDGNAVRCMRDAEFNVTTLEEIQAISDTYAVVTGNLDILDATVMDVKGFVFSNTTSDLKLGNDGCFVADADNALDGDMAVTLTGLKPNTRYYYRAYARGAYNTRYGERREFWTKAAGDVNEGFGSEDFDWAE